MYVHPQASHENPAVPGSRGHVYANVNSHEWSEESWRKTRTRIIGQKVTYTSLVHCQDCYHKLCLQKAEYDVFYCCNHLYTSCRTLGMQINVPIGGCLCLQMYKM